MIESVADHRGKPFSVFLLQNLKIADQGLIEIAGHCGAIALGFHPDQLDSDKDLVEVVSEWLTEILKPYVDTVAAPSLPLLALGDMDASSTGEVCDALMAEVEKVLDRLLPTDDRGQFLGDCHREFCLFWAIVACLALKMRSDEQLQTYYKVRRNPLGQWRRAREGTSILVSLRWLAVLPASALGAVIAGMIGGLAAAPTYFYTQIISFITHRVHPEHLRPIESIVASDAVLLASFPILAAKIAPSHKRQVVIVAAMLAGGFYLAICLMSLVAGMESSWESFKLHGIPLAVVIGIAFLYQPDVHSPQK